MNILITGHSRGLGAGLTRLHLSRGDSVYGLARTALADNNTKLHQLSADFSVPADLFDCLANLLPESLPLDRVYLNAGVIGPITAMSEVSLATLNEVMNVNLWANKVLLDALRQRQARVSQVIALSSGAAVRGNFGWGPYALSKAALNMLVQLYADEMPDTQLLALAPGLVDTDMQAELRQHSSARFPSLERLHSAHGSDAMPDASTAAAHIDRALQQLGTQPSGQFVDLRKL